MAQAAAEAESDAEAESSSSSDDEIGEIGEIELDDVEMASDGEDADEGAACAVEVGSGDVDEEPMLLEAADDAGGEGGGGADFEVEKDEEGREITTWEAHWEALQARRKREGQSAASVLASVA